MQQVSLLQTKLYIPPIRPDLVSRPRLSERLNAGLDRKLTVISAPAGFGKTTLVSEWAYRVRAHRVRAHRVRAHKVRAPGDAPQIAWLSLDEGDNDPTRFLSYVIAALRTIALRADGPSGIEGIEYNQEPCAQQVPVGQQPPVGLIGTGVLSALCSPQPPPAEAVLTSLINEISGLPDRMVLVLDDYHLIEAQPVHDAVAFLLQHLPPQMKLVIATREDPLLPLARLRARGQLIELRAADLKFTPAEATEFFNQAMGLDLSEKEIHALEARTEGWIAGLQLVALALQGVVSTQGGKEAPRIIESFTGSHRYVLDYLVEEVLEQQPESVQTFLLQTAVLDRLTGPLCDAVCLDSTKSSPDQGYGREILEKLDRANLFIVPLDEERRWYRYHHLFADLLRQRLRHTRPEWAPTLHLRASKWYEQNGLFDEAIEYALRAECFDRAACLLDERADALWTSGEHTKLRLWLGKLPGEVILKQPLLCVFHAWYLYLRGPRDVAEQYLQAVEQALDPDASLPEPGDRLPDLERRKVRGRAAAIRAFMASHQGDVPAIIRYARESLEVLPEQDLTWRSTAALALGDAHGFRGEMDAAYQARLAAAEASAAAGSIFFSIFHYLKVAITLREQGKLQRTLEICEQQTQLANSSGLSQASLTGCLLAIGGEVLAEFGDLERALAQTKRGLDLAERGEGGTLFGWSCMCLMRVLVSMGDLDGVQELVQKLEHPARGFVVSPWVTNQMAAWQTRMWLAQGKLEAASQWAHERGLLAAGEPQPLHEFDFFSLNDHLLLARVLIAQGRLDKASSLLPHLLKAAEAGGRTSMAIEMLNLQALALQAGGESSRALTTLQRALTLAQPEGFVQIFVDEGPPMAQLLVQAATRGIMPDYAAKLLAAFPESTKVREPAPGPPKDERKGFVVRPPAPAEEPSFVEPLSERELTVLRLIAEGLTNQEIATRLFLSLNTVKVHTRNIYGKLGVHSRMQAVARARALGILPHT